MRNKYTERIQENNEPFFTTISREQIPFIWLNVSVVSLVDVLL
jgi:hypothetical protein